jgi:hypothetical protein
MGLVRWGRWGYLLLVGLHVVEGLQQRSSTTVRRLGRCLAMVRAASGAASASRTCAKDSSSCLIGGGKLKFGGYLGFDGF